jgi:hypothetical protein
MLAMISVNTGRRNPIKVKNTSKLFPSSFLIMTQSRVPHSKTNSPQIFDKGRTRREIGKTQQKAIVIFAVFL